MTENQSIVHSMFAIIYLIGTFIMRGSRPVFEVRPASLFPRSNSLFLEKNSLLRLQKFPVPLRRGYSTIEGAGVPVLRTIDMERARRALVFRRANNIRRVSVMGRNVLDAFGK